jgi:hypothetical protein
MKSGGIPTRDGVKKIRVNPHPKQILLAQEHLVFIEFSVRIPFQNQSNTLSAAAFVVSTPHTE